MLSFLDDFAGVFVSRPGRAVLRDRTLEVSSRGKEFRLVFL